MDILRDRIVQVSFECGRLRYCNIIRGDVAGVVPFYPIVPVFVIFTFAAGRFRVGTSDFGNALPCDLFCDARFVSCFVR